jgi:NADPH:quinone reductase-like Zn-dependent oxidoreductase
MGPLPVPAGGENFCLEAATPGVLESLTYRPAVRRPPAPDQIEVEVRAAGLNFKDVLFALGLIPLPAGVRLRLGAECAGTVAAVGEGVTDLAVGDEVVTFGYGCFARFTTCPARLAVAKPAHLGFVEAATLPVAFTTAYVSLVKLARLRPGERVLIHAAAGGVGLAAVEVARWIGAEIFATAGSEEKREFLRARGVAHVFDSRSFAFADEVMQRTAGRGVEVVLNSLAGEFIAKSLSVLAAHGRFVEIGKRDVFADTPLGMRQFERGLSLHVVNLDWTRPRFPRLWREVMERFERGVFQPLRHRVYPAAEVRDAFFAMAQARHVGKLVVSLPDGGDGAGTPGDAGG